eukprot:13491737-Alexandrium_andersonii.AAC.1
MVRGGGGDDGESEARSDTSPGALEGSFCAAARAQHARGNECGNESLPQSSKEARFAVALGGERVRAGGNGGGGRARNRIWLKEPS